MSPASSSASGTPAPQDADEQNLLRLRIVLQYLMRQAAQGALKRGCIRDLNSLHMVFPPVGCKNALPQHSDRAYESTAKRQTGTQTLCVSHSRPCRSLCTALKELFSGVILAQHSPAVKLFFGKNRSLALATKKRAVFAARFGQNVKSYGVV